MRLAAIARAACFAIVFSSHLAARAQPYCAIYDTGTQNCGIPTLQSCQQSVSGVGGYCAPDETSQLRRPDIFRRPRVFQVNPNAAPPNPDNPNNPDWMPPPPDE